ncbi:MAG: CRISPR-associated helicase Cas3' [Chloroflexi bacterium]|nr:CRISPR-associated helicase Cas3' [Chloroflexota bacterium]MCL5110886.1 CRISPR-associated helicase Cas3' [Chloroflexota bacterium]
MSDLDPAKPLPEALAFLWAKLGRKDAPAGTYHPLICHMLDVAAVAHCLWREVLAPSTRRRLAEALGLPEEEAGKWIAFFAGLHDLGKASPDFAGIKDARDCGLRELLARAGYTFRDGQTPVPHGVATAAVAADLLTEQFGVERRLANRLAVVLGGHHGVLPHTGDTQDAADLVGSGLWRAARIDLALILSLTLGLPQRTPQGNLDNGSAMLLAGLVTVSDWLGSIDTAGCFPPATPVCSSTQVDAAGYFSGLPSRVLQVLGRVGWLSKPTVSPAVGFASLFPSIKEPTAVQESALALAERLSGPGLVILEAPMGQGKTEAAIYLMERWGASQGQAGCYFALPTQATSNQMFSRVEEYLARVQNGGLTNLQLLHGHSSLAAEFEVLREKGDELLVPHAVYGEAAYDKAPAAVVAAEWFTHRKRGLLASFGVGTVDQALMAVLQSKHVFVRLFGLAQRTVIVDEVHAYDTYMSTLLEQLLRWLGLLATPTIMLSATLPSQRRLALAEAYFEGLAAGIGAPAAARIAPESEHKRYPRLTWVSREGIGSEEIPTPAGESRTLNIVWKRALSPTSSGPDFPVLSELQGLLEANGGCAAWVCNTVGRAQEVYEAAKDRLSGLAEDGQPIVHLLHARFPYEEREQEEQLTLIRYGKPNGTVRGADRSELPVRRPARGLLIATQIIEQSLDLDFDLMVSEVAPVDLLLQRSGRVHRHKREGRLGSREPTLWLIEPSLRANGTPDFGGGTEKVYEDDFGVLLRTWLVLCDRVCVRVPEDVECLIESVYSERQIPAGLAPALAEQWLAAEEARRDQMNADAAEAKDRWLKKPDYPGELWRLMANPREEDAPEYHPSHQLLTRLAEPTVQAVWLYDVGARLSFDLDGRDCVNLEAEPTVAMAKRLLRRSIPISHRGLVFNLLAEPAPPGWRKSPLLRHHRVLRLDATRSSCLHGWDVRLDEHSGLLVKRKEGVPG